MAFVLWVQAVQQAAAPFTLETIVFAFAGLCAVGGLTVAVRVLKIVMTMKTAIYGDELSKEPSGLLHSLTTFREDFRVHVREETEWQQTVTNNLATGVTLIEARLQSVEERLPKPKSR